MNFVKEGVMRGVACLPYILPMMDALAYGRFLFQKVPLLTLIFVKPLQPFIDLAQAFPVSASTQSPTRPDFTEYARAVLAGGSRVLWLHSFPRHARADDFLCCLPRPFPLCGS